MRFVERFRRKPPLEFQLSDELLERVTDKLLDDLRYGYRTEKRFRELNLEDLLEATEMLEDPNNDEYWERLDKDDADGTGIHRSIKVILKSKREYYLVRVDNIESQHPWNNLSVRHFDLKEPHFSGSRRSVVFDEGWIRTSDEKGLPMSALKTQEFFKELIEAKVNPEMTFTYNTEERTHKRNKNTVFSWLKHSNPNS